MSLNYFGDCILTELENPNKIAFFTQLNGEDDVLIRIKDTINVKIVGVENGVSLYTPENNHVLVNFGELQSSIFLCLRDANLSSIVGSRNNRQYGSGYCKGVKLLTTQQDPIGEYYLVLSAFKDDIGTYNVFIFNVDVDIRNNVIEQEIVNVEPNFLNQDPRIYLTKDGKKGQDGVFLNVINNFNVNFIPNTTAPSKSFNGDTLILNIPIGETGNDGFTQDITTNVIYQNVVYVKPLSTVRTQITTMTDNYITRIDDSDLYVRMDFPQTTMNKYFNMKVGDFFTGSVNIDLNVNFPIIKQGGKLFVRITYTNLIDSQRNSQYGIQLTPITVAEHFFEPSINVSNIYNNSLLTYNFVWRPTETLINNYSYFSDFVQGYSYWGVSFYFQPALSYNFDSNFLPLSKCELILSHKEI